VIIWLDRRHVNVNYRGVEFDCNMPTKKPSLFEVSGKEPEQPKTPTWKQFVKENPFVNYPIYSRIEVIWFPGQWDNYSLVCESFRVSVSPKHPIFPVLEQRIVAALTDTDTALLLRVENRDGTIGFSESNVYGKYARIGNSGFKFEPTDGAN
jgi:hypothetical protein